MAFASPIDFIVMGAGVAGLRAAIALALEGNVLVVTKESLGESNTYYAQGGIAVASWEDMDDVGLHLNDTISAGDGLVYRPAAEVLVAEGPERVAELIEWGARFDRDQGKLLRTREGAHSRPRILHANGDATGAEISRSLVAETRAHPRIRFAEWTMVSRLLLNCGQVAGAELVYAGHEDGEGRELKIVSSRALLIASGGAGQVYSDTTNPPVATGDGIALALGAGAELADMEFYQFHPTAFSLPGAPRFLMSEALRGEGAYLRNDRGERFMEQYHPLLELAPRDIVARAITREGMGEQGETRRVYLDMRHVKNIDLHKRFPGITAFLARYKLDLHRDLIPVRPAAHYLMGGIRTDLMGRTNVGGLYAAGEVACTGVHGANRLASNSLLEGLVFGARAAKAMLEGNRPPHPIEDAAASVKPLNDQAIEKIDVNVVRLQSGMWEDGGLLRSESLLTDGLRIQAQVEANVDLLGQGGKNRRLLEAKSLCSVARAILCSAVARNESRGAHFRNDYPQRNDVDFGKHSIFTSDGRVSFEEL
ncbi:MAG TPA: L-aspartate oxidase [Terracidiphilus sp.]|nr:L-aspartate oxidase [Terracidiphilus sp.]